MFSHCSTLWKRRHCFPVGDFERMPRCELYVECPHRFVSSSDGFLYKFFYKSHGISGLVRGAAESEHGVQTSTNAFRMFHYRSREVSLSDRLNLWRICTPATESLL